MAPIDVRPQVSLPPGRILGLCLKGIRHRLFRSVLTTMVIVLAVAFFMNLIADSVIVRSVGNGITGEIRTQRRSVVAVDLWFGHPGALLLAQRLADGPAQAAGFAAVAGWDAARVGRLAEACRLEREVLVWLDQLDSGSRAMLVRRTRNDQVFTWLADEERWKAFATAAVRVRGTPLPVAPDRLRVAVLAAPATAAELVAFTTAWHARVEALAADLRQLTGTDSTDGWTSWLVKADAPGVGAFSAAVARHGFDRFPIGSPGDLVEALRTLRLRDQVAAALLSVDGRKRWLAAFHNQPPLEAMMQDLEDPRVETVLGKAFTRDELRRVRDDFLQERRLAVREKSLAGAYDPSGGLISSRQAFLVGISFLVCMVGIANAMLMAITERFREIATMKCLGATDGFILTQFLMEAGIQGAAGGAMGTVLGLLLSLAKGSWLYGGHLLWYFPLIGLIAAVAACIVVGLLLATLASIYPSWKASRMAPMEAMRVE